MSKTLFERLSALGALTASEKKLAHFFEHMHTGLAFENLTSISEKAGVGKSTVTRFVVRLGYPDFYTFIRHIKNEAASTLDTPLKRYTSNKEKNDETAAQPVNHLTTVQGNLKYTLEQISSKDFNRAARLIANTKKPLYLMGAATAQPLMHYFYLLLSYLRGNVVLLDGNAPTIAHRTAKIDKNSVLLSLAFNRYPKLTDGVMAYFSQKEAEIILITDRHTSPLLSHAKTKLIVHAEGAGMFKTRCSAMAMMEALLFEVANRAGEQIPQRYKEKTELMHHLDIYINE